MTTYWNSYRSTAHFCVPFLAKQNRQRNRKNLLSLAAVIWISSSRAHYAVMGDIGRTNQEILLLCIAQEAKVSQSVLLGTAIVIIEDPFGKTVQARAFLDSGISAVFHFRTSIAAFGIQAKPLNNCKQSISDRDRISSFIGEDMCYVL